jgi:3-hydroxyisobutyrate dehydrogenase
MGGPGAGQSTKCANQIMIASIIFGVCEGLLYAKRAGLNLDDMISLLQHGRAGSNQLIKFGPKI